MFDANYIDELKLRALAIGIQDDYIDENKIFLFYKGQFCLMLDNYVYYMLKSFPRISVYEIPDGVWGIIFKGDKSIFNTSLKKIKIVTNKDLMFFGSIETDIKMEPNKIALDLKNKFALKNVTIDFRKSKRLNFIEPHSFNECEIDTLYFGNGLIRVCHHSFCCTRIKNLSFTNLKQVDYCAFYQCIIYDNLDLGKEILSIEKNGLFFSFPFKDLIIRGNDLHEQSIANARNIYLCLDIDEDNEELINYLKHIIKQLESNKVTIQNVLSNLNDYINHYEEPIYRDNFMYDFTVACNEKNVNNIVKCINLLIVGNKVSPNVYFYSSNYSIDVYDVHDREYDLIYSSHSLNVYMEN